MVLACGGEEYWNQADFVFSGIGACVWRRSNARPRQETWDERLILSLGWLFMAASLLRPAARGGFLHTDYTYYTDFHGFPA
jgi:hypothetical protein